MYAGVLRFGQFKQVKAGQAGRNGRLGYAGNFITTTEPAAIGAASLLEAFQARPISPI